MCTGGSGSDENGAECNTVGGDIGILINGNLVLDHIVSRVIYIPTHSEPFHTLLYFLYITKVNHNRSHVIFVLLNKYVS